jgi:hypothetical protein
LIVCNQFGDVNSLFSVFFFVILATRLVATSDLLRFIECFLHFAKFKLLLTLNKFLFKFFDLFVVLLRMIQNIVSLFLGGPNLKV